MAIINLPRSKKAFRCKKEVVDGVTTLKCEPVLKKGDMIEDALSRLLPQKQLALYKHEGFWYGMDTYKDFMFLNKLWNEDPKWKIWE